MLAANLLDRAFGLAFSGVVFAVFFAVFIMRGWVKTLFVLAGFFAFAGLLSLLPQPKPRPEAASARAPDAASPAPSIGPFPTLRPIVIPPLNLPTPQPIVIPPLNLPTPAPFSLPGASPTLAPGMANVSGANGAVYSVPSRYLPELKAASDRIAAKRQEIEQTETRFRQEEDSLARERGLLDRSSRTAVRNFNDHVDRLNAEKARYRIDLEVFNASVRAYNARLETVGRRTGP